MLLQKFKDFLASAKYSILWRASQSTVSENGHIRNGVREDARAKNSNFSLGHHYLSMNSGCFRLWIHGVLRTSAVLGLWLIGIARFVKFVAVYDSSVWFSKGSSD